jgi:hypothetical protein
MADKIIGYRHTYKIRILVPGKKHAVSGIPYEVIEREAALRKLTVEEFIERFEVVSEYDNFDGIRQTFKEIDKGDNNGK